MPSVAVPVPESVCRAERTHLADGRPPVDAPVCGFARPSNHRDRRGSHRPCVAESGLALHLVGGAEPGGAHLENLVLNDQMAWRDARLDRADIFYWRTAIGEEVDLVIEAGGHLLPIEIKVTGRPRLGDATHPRTGLQRVRQECPRRAPAAHRPHARMARTRRAGRAVVEGAVMRSNDRGRVEGRQ